MKKLLSTLLIFVLVGALLAGCQSSQKSPETPTPQENQEAPANEPITIKVGASPVPHAQVLEVVKPLLAKEGIDLEIIEFNDYVQPNLQLADKELDANYFQHIPYLEDFSQQRGLDLTYIAKVHIEPMGIYSLTIDDLSQVPDGASVAIPNDATNGGRALLLLESAGLLKLKEDVGIAAIVTDIVENPKNLKFEELEAAMLPRTLEDVDLAVINSNYALEADLVPTRDSLFIEGADDSPYVNILAVRKGDENRPELKALADALLSEEVAAFIEEEFEGAVVPASK